MTQEHRETQLVKYLVSLVEEKKRGELAALRGGVGKRPGECARMLPIVARYLPQAADSGPSVEAIFLTAGLFAKHKNHKAGGSLGASLRLAVQRPDNPSGKYQEDGLGARLAAALDAHPEDLPRQLDQLVSLCASADVAIDWSRFQRDVRTLLGDDEKRSERIRIQWAGDFWGGPIEHKDEAE